MLRFMTNQKLLTTVISMNFMYCSSIPKLQEIMADPRTLLLFPGESAEDIQKVALEFAGPSMRAGAVHRESRNLILLDGTWLQAKALYTQNKFLHKLRQVRVQ